MLNSIVCDAPGKRRFFASIGKTLIATALTSSLLGCEVDSWFDPSRTGYFETTPTTMPILSRLDVIEQQTAAGMAIAPPSPEDLVPGELKYRLAPGDVVRIDVFELVTPGEIEREELMVDQTGNIRLKEVGDIVAAGLTLEEFQQEIESKVARLIANPVVQVSLARGQSFQFSISGAVNETGVFTLERPDFRLTEAIALAGGTLPTTQRVKVIRAAPLDDTLRPVYPEPQSGREPAPAESGGQKPATGGTNLDDLINQLDSGTKPGGRGSGSGSRRRSSSRLSRGDRSQTGSFSCCMCRVNNFCTGRGEGRGGGVFGGKRRLLGSVCSTKGSFQCTLG